MGQETAGLGPDCAWIPAAAANHDAVDGSLLPELLLRQGHARPLFSSTHPTAFHVDDGPLLNDTEPNRLNSHLTSAFPSPFLSPPARIIGPDRQTIATMAARGVSVLKFVGTVSLGVLTVRSHCHSPPSTQVHDASIFHPITLTTKDHTH